MPAARAQKTKKCKADNPHKQPLHKKQNTRPGVLGGFTHKSQKDVVPPAKKSTAEIKEDRKASRAAKTRSKKLLE